SSLAVAALDDVLLDPRRLHGVQRAVRLREALDGRDARTHDIARCGHARAPRTAIDVDRACAAKRTATPELRASEPGLLAEDPKEGGLGRNRVIQGFAVDLELHGDLTSSDRQLPIT